MATADISTLEKLRAQVGRETVVTDWVLVTQERIDRFANATGDFQWVHVDAERASRESPFGGTIAHGFLTLSLLGKFYHEDVRLPFCELGLNYGLNKVRFKHPVRAGSRLRGRFVLKKLDDIDGGIQLTWTITFEIEGQQQPACVANMWCGAISGQRKLALHRNSARARIAIVAGAGGLTAAKAPLSNPVNCAPSIASSGGGKWCCSPRPATCNPLP